MRCSYKPKGVCSQLIEFDLDGDVISNVVFTGGCNGNLKAISKLVDGMSVNQIAEKLEGNICGFKNTSCADQLAKGVLEVAQKAKA